MDTQATPPAALPRFNGFRHIIDDGDCQDHGYFLPKQHAKTFRSVVNCGVEFVEVPDQDLLAMLDGASAAQKSLLSYVK